MRNRVLTTTPGPNWDRTCTPGPKDSLTSLGQKNMWSRDRTAEQRSHKHAGTQLGPHKHAGTETELHKHVGIKTLPSSPGLTQEGALLLTQGAVLGRGPDGQAESDLVHKVREIVNQVQGAVVNCPRQVAEDVAQWVNGPANCDDEAHGIEGFPHVLVHFGVARDHRAGLTNEDLVEDETPAGHAEGETQDGVHEFRLACVAEREHGHGPEEQAQEHPLTNVGFHRREDQVELYHLQRDSDRPVDVAVEDGGTVKQPPELAHVEVVDGRDQGDQGTDVQRSLPMD